MGHHSVPQNFLENFGCLDQPRYIWQFDKKDKRFSKSPVKIKKVLQRPNFYDTDVERDLATHVEKPANIAMDKLRSGSSLTPSEWSVVIYYIATMIYRVERHREIGRKLAPEAIATVISNVRQQIHAAASTGKYRDDLIQDRLAQLEQIEEKYRHDVPDVIHEIMRSPWPAERNVEILFRMHWRLLETKGPIYFLTSDNPVFLFEGIGLANPRSELTFPISSTMALWGSWAPVKRLQRFAAQQSIVKEANRRLAFGASRFVLYRERADWIEEIALNEHPRLPAIHWDEDEA